MDAVHLKEAAKVRRQIQQEWILRVERRHATPGCASSAHEPRADGAAPHHKSSALGRSLGLAPLAEIAICIRYCSELVAYPGHDA
jgi:hypothetical protein